MVVSQNHPFIDIDFPLSSEVGVSPPQLMRINHWSLGSIPLSTGVADRQLHYPF